MCIRDSCIASARNKNEKQIIFIDGEAGTGKTVLNSSIFYELYCQEEEKDNTEFKCCMVVNHDEPVSYTHLIDATVEEFKQNGLKFTMNDLAKRLGISKKTIYTVFESKQAVLVLSLIHIYLQMERFFSLISDQK